MSALREYSLELGERVTRMGVGWCWRIRRGPGAGIRWIAGEVGVRRGCAYLGAVGPGPDRGTRPGTTRRRGAADQGAGVGGPPTAQGERDPEERVGLSIAAECERPSR